MKTPVHKKFGAISLIVCEVVYVIFYLREYYYVFNEYYNNPQIMKFFTFFLGHGLSNIIMGDKINIANLLSIHGSAILLIVFIWIGVNSFLGKQTRLMKYVLIIAGSWILLWKLYNYFFLQEPEVQLPFYLYGEIFQIGDIFTFLSLISMTLIIFEFKLKISGSTIKACNNCGAEINFKARFCKNCGTVQ